MTPLLVTWDNVIISGHRRWQVAKELGLESVPVVLYGSRDPLDIEETVIESNRQRKKTTDQIGREYLELKRIHHERDSRQGDNQDPVTGKFHRSVSNETKRSEKPCEKAAKQLGVSRTTAFRAERVVREIDALREEGKEKEAEKLEEKLNKSAGGAYEEVAQRARSERPKLLHTETYPVSDAMTFAEIAISQLERIRLDDPKRLDAIAEVEKWIIEHKELED